MNNATNCSLEAWKTCLKQQYWTCSCMAAFSPLKICLHAGSRAASLDGQSERETTRSLNIRTQNQTKFQISSPTTIKKLLYCMHRTFHCRVVPSAETKEIGHYREVAVCGSSTVVHRNCDSLMLLLKILDIHVPVSLLPPLIPSPCLPNHHQEGSSVNQKKITDTEQQLNKKLFAKVRKQKLTKRIKIYL